MPLGLRKKAQWGKVHVDVPKKPKTVDEKLRSLYYSLTKPGAVSGINSFWAGIQASPWAGQISKRKVVEWANQNPSYFLFRPKRKNFPRNKVIHITHSNFYWTCDLWDLQKWVAQNDKYRYVLVVSSSFFFLYKLQISLF